MDVDPEEEGGDPACRAHRSPTGDDAPTVRAMGGTTAPDTGASWPHDERLHLWWVRPGVLAGGEYPGDWSGDEDVAVAKLQLLVDAGFRTLVDLTAPEDPLWRYEHVVEVVAARTGADLRWVRFPIPDMSVGPDDLYDEILDAIAAGTERGAVYVHCWGGIGRTGTVVGCWLIDQGMSAEDALAHIAVLRAGTRKAHRTSPETRSQRDLLARRWARRSEAEGSAP